MSKAVSLKDIEYSTDHKPILQGVSFSCTINERVCIFGENGAGKSTLLKIIGGDISPDAGSVHKLGHARFFYVSQEFDRSYAKKSVEAYIKQLSGEAFFKKVFTIGSRLGFDLEKNKLKNCGSLSGGQQKILALAVAFALSPDFILLDEPENHLDIVSRHELISLMEKFRGGIIFVSHDRLVIDTIATKIGELVSGKMHISEGGYEDYIETKMERIGGLQRQYDAESKRIQQLSSTIVILRQKAHRGKEVSAYHRAQEELDTLKKDHKEKGRPDDKKTKIRISQTDRELHHGKLLCRIKNGSFKYNNSKSDIFRNAHLEIRSGEKIVLLGRNGSGKSTFLKCLTGEFALRSGEVTWAGGIKWAYFDQHAEFAPDSNPVEVLMHKLGCIDMDARAALGAMKFDDVKMKTPVGSLSGGERMRLRFALTFGQKPDSILLDEPTNHIDEVTWEILLDACSHSPSSILLVSHDYEFIQEFNPNVFWMMHGQNVVARHKDLDTLLEEMRQ